MPGPSRGCLLPFHCSNVPRGRKEALKESPELKEEWRWSEGGQDSRWGVTFKLLIWFCIILRKILNSVQGKKGKERGTEIQRRKEEKIEEEGNGRRKTSEKIIAAVKGL